jgi:hypothetical protein
METIANGRQITNLITSHLSRLIAHGRHGHRDWRELAKQALYQSPFTSYVSPITDY